jgi:hypothetical protein
MVQELLNFIGERGMGLGALEARVLGVYEAWDEPEEAHHQTPAPAGPPQGLHDGENDLVPVFRGPLYVQLSPCLVLSICFVLMSLLTLYRPSFIAAFTVVRYS